MNLEDLTGVWSLQQVLSVAPDGVVTQPYGPAPRGRLIYTAGAKMAVIISSSTELPAVAYSGSVRMTDETVFHDVEVGLPPFHADMTETRRSHLDEENGNLTLRGNSSHAPDAELVLTWHRDAGRKSRL